VRTEHLRWGRRGHDQVKEGIRGELQGEETGLSPGSDVAIDFEALAGLERFRREYASAYWAMLQGVCSHLVTNVRAAAGGPAHRGTVDLAAISGHFRSRLGSPQPVSWRSARRGGREA
jgi:hypothetical protein